MEMVTVYFEHLGAALKDRQPGADIDAIEAEWSRLYPSACEDFERFLRGWSVLRR
jgi:hypothetical protein